MKDDRNTVQAIVKCLGGAGNIAAVTNCMTRLRVVVKDEAPVDEQSLKTCDAVLSVVHDRANAYEIVVGPGKCRRYADLCYEMGLGSNTEKDMTAGENWQENKADWDKRQTNSRVKSSLKTVGDIFIPLIPGIITAGLCAGFASLISQLVPNYAESKGWGLLFNLLSLVNVSFMTYISAWVGYRAAERFGATPILGGMLGMITSLDGINEVAKQLGLYDATVPLNSVLHSGKGGVLAVITGVLLLSYIEKKIRSRMPDNVDIIFTPLLSLLICAIPYITLFMPFFGYVSSGIVWVFSRLCLSQSVLVRAIVGFISATLFLPLVATGMHHGLVALYSVQLQELGYVTLYPALAMAGAGQVGAAIAIWKKAKAVGNDHLCKVTAGALPAGLLGVGEPLIYGVTLPLGKPFLTAGLGSGFGGALVMAMEVASTTWGPSGLLGVFVMTAGPNGAIKSVLFYLTGLVVSYICSFVITNLALDKKELCPAAEEKKKQPEPGKTPVIIPSAEQPVRRIHHGEPVSFGNSDGSFEYTITDAIGIHARPAGELVTLVKGFDCDMTVSANGKTASATSVVELMSLGALQGTRLTVTAKGKDASVALRAVAEFLKEKL